MILPGNKGKLRAYGIMLPVLLLFLISGCHPAIFLPKDQYENIKQNDRLVIFDKNDKKHVVDPVRKTVITDDKIEIYSLEEKPLVLPLNEIAELNIANIDYPLTVLTSLLGLPVLLIILLLFSLPN